MRCCCAALLLAWLASPAAAQSPSPASASAGKPSLDESFTRALSFVPIGGTVSVDLGVTDLVRSVLTSQLATFPVGSSSGAFTYTYDEGTRTFARRARTLGPWFAERASSLGRARAFSVGSSVAVLSYSRLDGRSLKDGAFHSRQQYDGGGWSGRQLNMSLTTQTVALFGTYAVSPTVDVGAIVPFVRVAFDARATDIAGRALSHPVLGSGEVGSSAASSLGDVQARAKWNVVRSPRLDGAVQVDFRLPTGSLRRFTGVGAAREKLSALVSWRHQAFEHHVNLGYTFRLTGVSPGRVLFNNIGYEEVTPAGSFFRMGVEDVPSRGATSNELSYVVGSDWAVVPRTTLTMELVGRYLRDGVAFRARTGQRVSFDFLRHRVQDYDYIDATPANVNQIFVAVGGKVNVTGTILLTGHFLTSLTNGGLTIRPTAVFGVEHAF